MRHNGSPPRFDKRKIDYISVPCRRIEFSILLQANVVFTPHSAITQYIDACSGKPRLAIRSSLSPQFSYVVLGFPFPDKTPLERAQFLETTEIFADIHATLATSGQTAVPTNLDTDLHFTCFVQAPEASARVAETTTGELRLIELDGGRAGPVDRGKSTDLLKVRATWPGLVHFRGGLMDMWYLLLSRTWQSM